MSAADTKQVCVNYWVQDTMEAGRWVTVGPMSETVAKYMIDARIYGRGEIVECEAVQ